jgi:subtilisin family serine protease
MVPVLRESLPASCPANVNCIPGFKRVYRVDPTPVFVPLKVADAGVQALDDGVAEVAEVFTSNPQLSRPDILPLRDDKHMITEDHIVPVVRSTLLATYGAALRKPLDATSALLTTLRLRGLNQQVIDGRLPEAVGGEFADTNGLIGSARTRRGPPIVLGFQAFDENEMLAHLYAETLRGAGFRVRVRPSGLRPETVKAFRRGRIDAWIGYSGSLLGYLRGTSLRRALARIGATPLRLSQAQDRNSFAIKRDVAAQLGISTLSELARHWPAVSGRAPKARAVASSEARQDEQWAVSQDVVLDLPGAWELSKGAGVTVAVLDSGARLDHPDLAPNIWVNFDEVPGNGVDDDNNGYVDDVHGVDLSSTAPGQDLSDGHGHGTHVAGIIAAALNARGVVGAAPQAKLMIVKVLGNDGGGSTGSIAEGIRYAAANGARIINMSLTSPFNDARVAAAVQAAAAANVLVVASAGNDGVDIDKQPTYPAALPASNLLAVASTDPQDGRAISDFSNYGRLAVQLAAPGAAILSTSNSGEYEEKSGTSMAAPMVAGVAALVAGANPQISAVDLRAALMQNAARSDLPIAAGYVDALHTVLAATGNVGYQPPQPPSIKVLSATSKGKRTKLQVAVAGATAAVKRYRIVLDARYSAQMRARRTQFTVTVGRAGKRVRVDALNASGRVVAHATRRVTAPRKGKRDVGTGGGVRT